MQQYLDLLRTVLDKGVQKPTRARLSGKHIDAISVFGAQARFDLREGFPAVTTKRLAFRSVVHELLWFLQGSTNIHYLKDSGVSIWDEWADEAGELGPVYGKQWRDWVGANGRHVDQIATLIDNINHVKEDPTFHAGRRLIISAWNVTDLPYMALQPCHILAQFSVTNDELSCSVYMRSADAFLGVPFNIASYALLTHMIAQVTDLKVGDLVMSFGDLHIYVNHRSVVETQLTRSPLPLPQLKLDKTVREIDDFAHHHISLLGYNAHPSLKGEISV